MHKRMWVKFMDKERRLKEAEECIGKVFKNKSRSFDLVDLYIIVTDAKIRDYSMVSSSISSRDKIFQDSVTISYVELTSKDDASVQECPLSYLKYSFKEV